MDNLTALHWLYACALFVIGLPVGSFLNVVIYRTPLGKSIITPASACPNCGESIKARDNIPVLGWLLLAGKCRNCRSPISLRYPVVELANAILWGVVGWRLAGLDLGYWNNVAVGMLHLAFVSAMVVTFLVDLDHRIILDEVSLGGLAAAVVAAAAIPALPYADTLENLALHHPILYPLLWNSTPWVRGLAIAVTGAVFGLLFSLAIVVIGNAIFKRKLAAAQEEDPDVDTVLGMGDVKLMAFFGALLGWESVLFVFMGASFLASIVGTVNKFRSGDPGDERGFGRLLRRWRTGDSVIAFGPFLAVAAVIYFFFEEKISVAAMNLFPLF